MVWTWVLAAAAAWAVDEPQTLTWQLALNGNPVGERTLTIRQLPSDAGVPVRLLEMWTEIDAQVAGFDFAMRYRVTGTTQQGPASFHSVVNVNGASSEVQVQPEDKTWQVTLVEPQGSRTWDLASSRVDLSTLDITDPQSAVRIADLDIAQVISVETGDILAGPVVPLGASSIAVAGEELAVNGYRWTSDRGAVEMFYTPEGVLVNYRTKLLGQKLEALLTAPPPTAEDGPLLIDASAGIQEVEL